MRYGEPSIDSALESYARRGAAVCSCCRCTRSTRRPRRPRPSTRSPRSSSVGAGYPVCVLSTQYHDHPRYIEALAQSGCASAGRREGRAARLLFSFHGIPLRYFQSGDPYHCQCQKTARLTAEKLGLEEGRVVCFVPIAGRSRGVAASPTRTRRWKRWGREGVESVQALCPGLRPTAWRPWKRSTRSTGVCS